MSAPVVAPALRTVFVVCEGQTEETFISRVVAPEFYRHGLNLVAQLVETSSGHKGGALSYDRVKRHLRNNLRRLSQPVVTTLIDLYRLDNGFPGFADAAGKPLDQRLRILNAAFHQNIVREAKCRPDHFLPYIQPFEFEALLFSDTAAVTDLETGWASAAALLAAARAGAPSPEHINDGANTKPAARFRRHLTNPPYNKVLHGPNAAELIGLAKIESECKFFAAWLEQLRLQGTPGRA